ncbi:MAG: hypothetical protein RSB93_06005 [Rikenellaceae bacterium]
MTKESKRNIIVMCIIGAMFLIGIAVRWDYVTREIKFSIDRYTKGFEYAQKEVDKVDK